MKMAGALSMYDLPGVEADVDILWRAIAERIDAEPVRQRPDDLHHHWASGAYILSQTCGFPLVDELDGMVDVVGVFTTAVSSERPGHYRSVIIAPLENNSGPVAMNSWDSLSGYVSLACYLQRHAEASNAPRPDVRLTGGHRHSLAAVASGAACLASIDAVTFDILSRTEPDHVAKVQRVGVGPLVPCLPLVTPDRSAVVRLRRGIAAALQDSGTATAQRNLSITGFLSLDQSDFLGIRDLIASARTFLPPEGS